MTCRDWIVYILANGLEDEPFFEDGRLAGFMTVEEYAAHMNVGVATVNTWAKLGTVKYITIGDTIYIPKIPVCSK